MDCSPFGELLWGQLALLVWHRAAPHLFPQMYPMLCLPPAPAPDCQNLATGTQYSLEAILVAEQNTWATGNWVVRISPRASFMFFIKGLLLAFLQDRILGHFYPWSDSVSFVVLLKVTLWRIIFVIHWRLAAQNLCSTEQSNTQMSLEVQGQWLVWDHRISCIQTQQLHCKAILMCYFHFFFFQYACWNEKENLKKVLPSSSPWSKIAAISITLICWDIKPLNE